jgi:hypothetical protein
MNMLDHLESFLGPTEGGYEDPAGDACAFQIVDFTGGPVAKARTYCTLGLSEYLLEQPDHTSIRLELMFVAQDTHGPMSIPALVHDLAVEAIARHRAYVRGEVIGPRGPLFPDSELEAIYVTAPMHLPTEFNYIDTEDGEPCIIAWLLPITCSEVAFIHSNGWESFEGMLVEHQPDVFDMFRTTFVR